MTVTMRFPSVLSPRTTQYLFLDDWDHTWSSRKAGMIVWRFAGAYDTYGDGLTQHSHERAVLAMHSVDYLLSLAMYLRNAPPEHIEAFVDRWPRPGRGADIAFAAGLSYKPDKVQYYCPADRKVSSAASKRNDRRWFKVDDWMTGTFSAIERYLHTRHEGEPEAAYPNEVIERYVTHVHIAETIRDRGLEPYAPDAVNALEDEAQRFHWQTWADRDRATLRAAINALVALHDATQADYRRRRAMERLDSFIPATVPDAEEHAA